MRAFFSAAIVLCVTTTCHAVSNRVLESLEDLAKIGFVFTAEDKPVQDAVTFRARIPREFKISDDVGTKPFSSVSLMQLDEKVEHGPKLIGAPGSHTPLESQKTKDGCHETKVSVPLAKAGMSYLVITFAYQNNADWPMLVHVPVSSIVKQLKARQTDAPGAPPTSESASSPNRR